MAHTWRRSVAAAASMRTHARMSHTVWVVQEDRQVSPDQGAADRWTTLVYFALGVFLRSVCDAGSYLIWMLMRGTRLGARHSKPPSSRSTRQRESTGSDGKKEPIAKLRRQPPRSQPTHALADVGVVRGTAPRRVRDDQRGAVDVSGAWSCWVSVMWKS